MGVAAEHPSGFGCWIREAHGERIGPMGKGILLWLLGVPIPIIILLWLLFH